MERRRETTTADDNTDLPRPWRDETITKAAWEKHKDYLMSGQPPGSRHDGWWLYERGMEPPEPNYTQSRILFEMGELKGGELQTVLGWWRGEYDHANDMPDRRKHWRWHDIPPALIKQWDKERHDQSKT